MNKLLLVLGLLALTSCSNMTNREQRTLSGAAIGTGVGAVGTGIAGGNPIVGGIIGGVVGGVVGHETR